MKKILVIVLSALSLMSSCSKSFLDEYPKGTWHSENMPEGETINAEILVEAKIQEAMSKLRGWSSVWPYLAMCNYPSNEVYKGSTPSDGGADMLSFETLSYNSSNGLIKDFYSNCYSTIFSINEALAFVETIKTSAKADLNKINKYQAECIFLRALMYYRLTQAFGAVPYIDHLMQKNEKSPARMDVNELRAHYINDLAKAIPYLPTREELKATGNSGRPTQNGARAIIAKSYLYEKNWNEVKNYTLQIINSGDNDLSTPFAVIFDEINEFGPESVLEINCELDHQNKIYMDSQFGEIQGFRGTPDFGWGFNVPDAALVKAFEPGDPRKDATILKDGDVYDGYTFIADPASNGMCNKKAYAKKSEFNIKGRVLKDHGKWTNIRLIRYSDILLMYAEACCELGELDEAKNKLEMVRNRARAGKDVLPYIDTNDQTELRKAIHHERRIELALEFDTFYDLIRWGEAEKEIANFVKGKHELYPIPQIEIDKGEGVVEQNPGY